MDYYEYCKMAWKYGWVTENQLDKFTDLKCINPEQCEEIKNTLRQE